MRKKIVDLRGIREKAELHELLKRKLRFPDYYGNNLDALYDVMTEPRYGMDLALLVDETTDSKLFDSLLETLKDAQEANSGLKVRVFRECRAEEED